jgi:hypothetical protein
VPHSLFWSLVGVEVARPDTSGNQQANCSYGHEIPAPRKGFRAFWLEDRSRQIPGRNLFASNRISGEGGRGCRLLGLKKARLESASMD